MAIHITAAEFHHVTALLRSMLVEAGLGAWEIEPWLTKAAARLAENYQNGTAAYFVEYVNGTPVGMAGALLREQHNFLSLKTGRYGRVVDEYVRPEYRGRGLELKLQSEADTWITQNNAKVLTATPPDVARLTAHSGGGKL